MLELRVLGSFEIHGPATAAAALLAQPKRAALLAYLTLTSPRGLQRRDSLLGLFWPESDDAHARHALNQALHHLRVCIGADAIVCRGDEDVGVDSARVSCDAILMQKLLHDGRLEEGTALYRGDLLPGFHVQASNEFDQWLERTRYSLRDSATKAARALARRAEEGGNLELALHWARRATDASPDDECCAQQVIRLLMLSGNAAAGRAEWERFATRIRLDLGVEPSPETRALLSIAGVPAVTSRANASPPAPAAPASESRAPDDMSASRRRPSLRHVGVSALAAVLLLWWVVSRNAVRGGMLAPDPNSERATILVSDFIGPPGDTLLGDVATQLVLSGLQDSRAARVVWSGEAADALRRMKLPATTRVRGTVARELAEREGFGALLEGRVSDVGGKLLVNLTLVQSRTGHLVFSEAGAAEDARALTATIDRLARSLRDCIGDSAAAIARAKPLEKVTTSSIEALRKFSEARRIGRNEVTRTIALLEQAVQLDPSFAVAYRSLGVALWSIGQQERSSEMLLEAVRHSDRMNEAEYEDATALLHSRERFYDPERSLRAYDAMLERDSSNGAALLNKAYLLERLRRFREAEQTKNRAFKVARSPYWSMYTTQAATRFLLGRNAEAWRTYDEAIRRQPHALVFVNRARAFVMDDKPDSAESDLRRASQLTPAGDRMLTDALVAGLRSSLALRAGHLRDADRYEVAAIEAASSVNDPRFALAWRVQRIYANLEVRGRSYDALPTLTALRRIADTLTGVDRPIPDLAVAYALAGDAATAMKLVRDYDRTITPGEWRELSPSRHRARGYIALAEGRAREAIRELRLSDSGFCVTCQLPVISLAYERAGETDSAIAVGERYLSIIDPHSAEADGFNRPKLHRRLAALYAQRGDHEMAELHLRSFIGLWSDADPELRPQVDSARAALAGLARFRGRY